MDNYARQIDVHEGGDDGDVARNCKKERFNEIPKKMIILSGERLQLLQQRKLC